MTGREQCEFCDGKMEQRIVLAPFHFMGQTIYVDRVPAWVCTQCGEQYFDAPVYKALEEIAKRTDQIKKSICFPLAKYDVA